jgi:hypothetical protein
MGRMSTPRDATLVLDSRVDEIDGQVVEREEEKEEAWRTKPSSRTTRLS